MALCKLAHDCVAVDFLGNQGFGDLIQGPCKPKIGTKCQNMAKKVFKEKLVQRQSWPYFVVAF